MGAITNEVLKFKKVIEFQNSCTVICFSQIYIESSTEKHNLSLEKVVKNLQN